MTVVIAFELEDEDLAHFREVMQRARKAAENLEFGEIIDAARDMTRKLRDAQLPKFVEARLDGMDKIVAMAMDADWRLPEKDAERLIEVLAYFCEPEDLIPDDTPGIGFLDDAIMMELVMRELKPELDAYGDFCDFREKEADKRRGDDSDAAVTRSDWLDAKRAELHDQAHLKRAARAQSGLFSSLFSIL